jgi:hypothetical protein
VGDAALPAAPGRLQAPLRRGEGGLQRELQTGLAFERVRGDQGFRGMQAAAPSTLPIPIVLGWTRLDVWQWMADEAVLLDGVGLDWYSDGGAMNCKYKCEEYLHPTTAVSPATSRASTSSRNCWRSSIPVSPSGSTR